LLRNDYLLSNYQDSERRKNADSIVILVEAYQSRHGSYPENLEVLAKDLSSSLPTSNWGFQRIEFDYLLTDAGATFLMDYEVRHAFSYRYSSKYGKWSEYD